MIHEVLVVGALQCNCSILGDETSREAIVVDPGDDIPRILSVLAKHHLALKLILVTHAHIDHIAGAADLKAVTGAPVVYSQLDLPLVKIMGVQAGWFGLRNPTVHAPDESAEDGQVLRMGEIAATILHVPGHSEGSLCLHFPDQKLLIAGDTLFAGAIGRTDLPGGNARTLIRSIEQKLLALPDETIVVPGHGSRTSIGEEREFNPFLR